MRLVYLSLVSLFVLFASGCANHANIEVPDIPPVVVHQMQGKTVAIDLLYAQPMPGAFSGGEQQELKPMFDSDIKISKGAEAVLHKFGDQLVAQLPQGTSMTQGDGDYRLQVELTAYDKEGPSYPKAETGKNFLKGVATFGVASDEFNIIADFDITYQLTVGDQVALRKNFKVKESVVHERGPAFDMEGMKLYNYARDLFRRHIELTSAQFFEEVNRTL